MKGMSALRPSFKSSSGTTQSSSWFKKFDEGIGSGILSPASGSTSVTPITPITPLTTPRTPLQILLGRNNGVGGPFRRSSIPRYHQSSLSDDDDDDQYREKQRLALQLIANFLNTAETTLNDIMERESAGQQVLGPGIVRVCHDLADEIEGVAKELRKEHTRAAQHLAHAISDHELNLIEEGEHGSDEDMNQSEVMGVKNETTLALASLTNSDSVASFQSQEEFISTLSTTHTLLIDTATALRAITHQEAQELGEVALDVARMFLRSLGMIHSNMIQMTVLNDYQPQPIISHHAKERQERITLQKKTVAGIPTKQNRVTWYNENTPSQNSPVIEILGEEEKKDCSPQKITTELRYSPRLSHIPSSPGSSSVTITSSSGHSWERVRVLWPPLLPAMNDAGKLCANCAKEHPIPAIAIALTCGPAAILTAAIVGPPLLAADWAIQNSYDALSEHTPMIENVEKGAASALQVARLAVLCSKLVTKQGLTVVERQIERRGGAGRICSDVVGGVVDMATHPVETACMTWGGIFWMGGALRDAVGFVKDTVSGGDLQMDVH